MPKDHSDPVADLRSNTSVPFEQARAMPTSVYTAEDFVEAELKHVFSKDWYCVGRADALSKTGYYVTAELAGQPIVVLRDADHQCADCGTTEPSLNNFRNQSDWLFH